MKIFLKAEGLRVSLTEDADGLEIVGNAEEADIIISDNPKHNPCIKLSIADGNSVDIEGIGYVDSLDIPCQEAIFFVDAMELKPDRVSFVYNGEPFALKDSESTPLGDIKVKLTIGGEEQSVILRVGTRKGICLPNSKSDKQSRKSEYITPLNDSQQVDLATMGMDLLEDVNEDELNGKVVIHEHKIQETKNTIQDTSEIKDEEDLLMFSSGLMGGDED
jgi:hypothetical protein